MHDLAPFLGHFHPVWVHLPIGIFLLLALLEGCALLAAARPFRGLPVLPGRLRTLVLAAGTAAALLAALLGWLLARGGDYDPALLHRHQVLGFAAAAGALGLLAVHRWRPLYLPALAAFVLLLALAGHAGGTLTHGEGYLTAHLPPRLGALLRIRPPPPPARAPFDQAAAFRDVVQPILNERCISCHGTAKVSGGLRLDSWEQVAYGGRQGALFKGGDLAASRLVRRLELPEDDKEHMPPRGKPQLGGDDLTLIEWWVASGAPPAAKVADLDRSTAVEDILDQRLDGHPPVPVPDRALVLAEAVRTAASLGIIIRSLAPDAPWLDVNATPAGRHFGDLELARLLPLAAAIVWLDLDDTAVTEGGLGALRMMPRLERLHLAGLKIGDAGLGELAGLRHLEYLNLRGTRVTDHGLPALRGLSDLRSLYVWQTAVTPAAVQALGDRLVNARRLALWTAQRAELDRRIAAEHFEGNTGEALLPPVPPPAH